MKYLLIVFIFLNCGNPTYIEDNKCISGPETIEEFREFLSQNFLFCDVCVKVRDIYACGDTVIVGSCTEDSSLVLYKRYVPNQGIYLYVYSRGKLLYTTISTTKNILICGRTFPCTFNFQVAWCTFP
jgi:hypothetical protein